MPDIPEINNNIDVQIIKLKVRIIRQGNTVPIEGELLLSSDVLITPDNKKIQIKEINRINILMWEKRSKLNRHIFYPSRYELLFRDYRKIIINGNIESLNKLKVITGKSGFLYLYFYDYLKNGKWINNGASDFDSIISKPADGCVIFIELI